MANVGVIAYRQEVAGHPPVYMFFTSIKKENPRTESLEEANSWYKLLRDVGCGVTLEPNMDRIRHEMLRGLRGKARKSIAAYYEKSMTQLTDNEKAAVM